MWSTTNSWRRRFWTWSSLYCPACLWRNIFSNVRRTSSRSSIARGSTWSWSTGSKKTFLDIFTMIKIPRDFRRDRIRLIKVWLVMWPSAATLSLQTSCPMRTDTFLKLTTRCRFRKDRSQQDNWSLAQSSPKRTETWWAMIKLCRVRIRCRTTLEL